MSSFVLLHTLLALATSHSCSDAVDKFTGLTKCELRDIERQIKAEQKLNPIPNEVRAIDSTLAVLNKRKHALLLDWKYKNVSAVCFRNKLSVTNRVVNDTFFICLDEWGN